MRALLEVFGVHRPGVRFLRRGVEGNAGMSLRLRSAIIILLVVIIVILLGAFAIGCAWLMITLIDHDKLRYCFASGRHNCAQEIE